MLWDPECNVHICPMTHTTTVATPGAMMQCVQQTELMRRPGRLMGDNFLRWMGKSLVLVIASSWDVDVGFSLCLTANHDGVPELGWIPNERLWSGDG